MGPRRWGVRLWRLGEGVVEGVWPRAWDITFVLPKKRLERDIRRVGAGKEGVWKVPAI